MNSIKLCVLLITVTLAVNCQSPIEILDPCVDWLQQSGNNCLDTQECRLVMQCVSEPCQPDPTCVPILPPVSSCLPYSGKPVLSSNYDTIWCSDARPCPTNYTCNTEVQDTQSTCCWDPPVSQPRSNPCIATLCTAGETCEVQTPETCPEQLPGTPCEPVGVCISIWKPGQCPDLPYDPTCANLCDDDRGCPGDQKCCKNGCGKQCSNPEVTTTTEVTTTPVPTQPYPCAALLCQVGFQCRLQEVICVRSPCFPSATCSPAGPPPTEPRCSIGLPVIDTNEKEIVCDPETRPCPSGTFCNTKVKGSNPVCCHLPHTDTTPSPMVKPGSCPSTDGQFGTCVELCSGDSSCPGTQKCCSHGCGHSCQEPARTTPAPNVESYPCIKTGCRSGFECRLKANTSCDSCLPQPTCIPELPNVHERRCSIGEPVVDNNNVELFCGRGLNRQNCSQGTSCNVHPTDVYAVCCYDPDTYTTPSPIVKPGSCPSTDGQFGTCVELCSGDSICPGTQKCCSHGCGHSCQEPARTTPAPKVESNPCSKMKCRGNKVCRLQKVRCSRRPCPPVGKCVFRVSVIGARRCSSGFSVMDLRRRQMSCTRNRPDCPDNTVCARNVCCWDTSTQRVR